MLDNNKSFAAFFWNKHTNYRELLKDVPWVTQLLLSLVYWINYSSLGMSMLYVENTNQQVMSLWHIPYRHKEILLFNLGHPNVHTRSQVSSVAFNTVSDRKQSSIIFETLKIKWLSQSNTKLWNWDRSPSVMIPIWGPVHHKFPSQDTGCKM